ncbi:glycine zipper domain-containing protein [Ectothiorhodospira sp. BSL-9]|uniref:glycine zipper domain-containing protein n=1 Tax=Ectothiorhodospira sp. BSL-9 TaxID=1442136 RepID=UPI0007B43BF4|nr:glycine zipper domain-containing protein [Ectothiorhodospira sp. BSL-9]ANB03814.1 membrane protein [Ectothiorhodospira sp. BSL-9]
MNIIKTTLPVILAGALVTGCAHMDDTDRTRTEGTAAGALLGGLLGYAVDGERGAVIGGLLGAGAGYVVGNEVAKRKRAYATTEDFLDGEATRVAEFNTTTAAYNQEMKGEIAALERESRDLRARYDAGSEDKKRLQAQRQDLQRQLARSEKLEKALEEELKVQQAILAEEGKERPANDPYLARLEREVAELQGNLEELREGSSQLARIDQRLSV